ncbi:hypothetical protein B005_0882 [Nocardiopsis alba ATCC BAA-2165]|uniref:Uncharacterized protein n=3 Tax=Nocardiopsis TaxID=2013 RepID=J7LCJ9_NOCAA|nr:hypothetical protein B005_0882 [Nocardiopsis alba ATCC BAA-2165]
MTGRFGRGRAHPTEVTSSQGNVVIPLPGTVVREMDRDARSPSAPREGRRHALTIAAGAPHDGGMSAGELLVQRLHVDLRQQASALCRS